MTSFIKTTDVNDLLPVALSSGTGRNVIIPANQPDLQTVEAKIRDACVEMGLVSYNKPCSKLPYADKSLVLGPQPAQPDAFSRWKKCVTLGS